MGPPGTQGKGKGKIEPPPDWESLWDAIAAQRRENYAPVDDMGCEVLADPTAPAATQRYQTLVALMMSSQTKDEVNAATMQKLKKHGLTVENIMRTSEATLNELIHSVGFHNKKAAYIKEATRICHEEYGGDIPRRYEDIVALKGVGPKMGYLLMHAAWNDAAGIGVDVHLHRICARLGWTRGAKTPEATRLQLQSWLPRSRWHGINPLLVGHGQTVCAAKPNCDKCGANRLCPSSSI